jgi:glutamate racemase
MRPIGVFDSGVGGLTVLHELLVALPQENFLYLGDTARFPYGTRSRDELESFAIDVAEALLARRTKLLVVACNSATAAAMPALRRRLMETTLGVDVLGVVRPEAVQAAAVTHTGRIGLLATPATVGSGAYAEALAAVDPHVTLTAVPCPDHAPLIQGGFPFDESLVDTVILGCTHYPLVRPMLQRMLGPGVHLVTSGAALARQVGHALAARGLTHPGRPDREGDYRFLTTGDVESFRMLGTRFLQMPLGQVRQVDVRDPRKVVA